MKINKKLLIAVMLITAARPYAAYADEYNYIGTNVLDLINANAAYKQGYTGRGVTVGVADYIVNFAHPEFGGKQNSGIVHDELNGDYGGLTWYDLDHGTHVAGIIAANKDGVGMHGVAYGADIASSSTVCEFRDGGFITSPSIYDYYLAHPDIKIINNSWGTAAYLANAQNSVDYEWYAGEFCGLNHFNNLLQGIEQEKLMIFAAGNMGHITPSIDNHGAVLTGNKNFADNILNVTAVKADSFSKNQDGSFLSGSDGIAIFSDLAMYAEDSTLSAPGWHIYSANADFKNPEGYGGYIPMDGTSQATPIVSGVGALVQEAFPYLNGKQIGDVLLSTANDKISVENGYFITTQYDVDDNGQYHTYLNVYYTGSEEKSFDEIKKDILDYYEENPDSGSQILCLFNGELLPLGKGVKEELELALEKRARLALK